MNIGQKIKELRLELGLTQEAVADTIGVTRQTLSSWENNKSFPDTRVIAMLSELYGVSISVLIGEDVQTTKEVKEQKEMIARRKYLYQCMQIALFILLWCIMIAVFWIGGSSIPMLYSLVFGYALIPMLILVFGVVLGADEMWKWGKWLFVLLGGAVSGMWYPMTYGLANTLSNQKSAMEWIVNTWKPELFWLGIGLSAAGIVIGVVLKQIKRATVKRYIQQ